MVAAHLNVERLPEHPLGLCHVASKHLAVGAAPELDQRPLPKGARTGSLIAQGVACKYDIARMWGASAPRHNGLKVATERHICQRKGSPSEC